MSSGALILRPLCTWQRWISAKPPKVSRTARLSALAPSTMNKRAISGCSPRSLLADLIAGFCERLMYQSLDSNLRADKMSTVLNGKIIPEDNARRMVAYARVQGWLAPEATS